MIKCLYSLTLGEGRGGACWGMERRVVVTGMGIWSCLGTNLDTVRQSLFDGCSGASRRRVSPMGISQD